MEEIYRRPLLRMLNRIPLKCAQDWRRKLVFEAQYRRVAAELLSKPDRFAADTLEKQAYLDDATANTGFDAHYVYHTAWAARRVRELAPARHVDISSSLYFCSIVSAFLPVDFYDYRPADLHLDNLRSQRADLMALPFPDGSVETLSCMHVIEHVGLGRYGEPLDLEADRKAVAEIYRVLKPGGVFLFVVPVGVPRIVFHAHRIYSLGLVRGLLEGFSIRESALLPDDCRGLVAGPGDEMVAAQRYACGCFLAVKKG